MHTPPKTVRSPDEGASVDLRQEFGGFAADAISRESPPRNPISEAERMLSEGAVDEALRIIFREWIGELTGPSPEELDALCTRLPSPYVDDPRILIVRACVQDALGANRVAQMLLSRARAAAAQAEDLDGLDWLLAFSEMMLLDDRSVVRESSRRAWQLLSDGVELGIRSRAAALHHIGWAFLRHRGEPEQGVEILEFAMHEASLLGDEVLRRRAARHLAFTLAWAGRLRRAKQLLDELEQCEDLTDSYQPWRLNTYGDTAAATSYIAYWSNDLELARSSIAELESPEVQVVSFAGTARMMALLTAAAARDSALIRRATMELQEVPVSDARGISWEAFKHLCIAVLAEASGNRDRAITIARRYAQHDDLPLVTVVLSGILRRAGKPVEALRMLNRLQRYRRFSYVRVVTLTTTAIVSFQEGNVSTAHELCERALDLAARENLRNPFCEWDLSLRQLLTAHLSWGTRHETFISECLTDQVAPETLETLSQRERTVFAQLRTIRTVPEIAEALGVSTNTVKTHLKSIYRKLGVSSRREAVRRFIEDTA